MNNETLVILSIKYDYMNIRNCGTPQNKRYSCRPLTPGWVLHFHIGYQTFPHFVLEPICRISHFPGSLTGMVCQCTLSDSGCLYPQIIHKTQKTKCPKVSARGNSCVWDCPSNNQPSLICRFPHSQPECCIPLGFMDENSRRMAKPPVTLVYLHNFRAPYFLHPHRV